MINDKNYKLAVRYFTKRVKKHVKKCMRRNLLRTSTEGSSVCNIKNDFFSMLEERQRSHGRKKQNYCELYYFASQDGDLCVIKSRGHDTGKSLGKLLERRHVISNHDAYMSLQDIKKKYNISCEVIKQDRIIKDLEKSLSEYSKKVLSVLFDTNKKCTMVIDKDFKTAYEPRYKDSAVYQGDLVSACSCMSERGEQAQEFYGSIPCCNVVRFEADGEQVGRCIMYEWQGKRHFIRIYGRPEYHPTMYKMLKKEMKEDDMFGRSFSFPDLEVETTATDETHSMYLDGNSYGFLRTNEGKYIMYNMYMDKKKLAEKYNNSNYIDSNEMKSTDICTIDTLFGCGEDDEDYYTCDCCGARVHCADAIWADDMCYCCSDCLHESGYYYCDYCERIEHEDNGVWCGDNFYCSEECAERDGWSKCDCCGEWTKDGLTSIDNGDMYVCESCLEDYEYCEECGEYYSKENMEDVIDTETGKQTRVCYGCKDDNEDRFIPVGQEETKEAEEDDNNNE